MLLYIAATVVAAVTLYAVLMVYKYYTHPLRKYLTTVPLPKPYWKVRPAVRKLCVKWYPRHRRLCEPFHRRRPQQSHRGGLYARWLSCACLTLKRVPSML